MVVGGTGAVACFYYKRCDAEVAGMASKLIELADGTLVEVEVSEHEARQISSREAKAVEATEEWLLVRVR